MVWLTATKIDPNVMKSRIAFLVLSLSSCFFLRNALASPNPTTAQKLTEQQQKLVKAAIERTKQEIVYDSSYYAISYPGGDIPVDKGVCTDVVVRSYRVGLGIDLQLLVHEDMRKHFKDYPQLWGAKKPDTNIDHRRVPNLACFFQRKGSQCPVSENVAEYQAGDIVVWNLAEEQQFLPHIGLVTDQKNAQGVPYIVRNIGQGPVLDACLFTYKIIGHYRYFPAATKS